MTARTVRLRYFADIRFPIERANGVQTMATCHALAGRGHAVDLVVRPDTHVPARDPYAYYGLPPATGLRVTAVPVPTAPALRRPAYLAHAFRLSVGTDDADVVFTRDLALAAWLLRVPAAMRPPLVYESHGYAPAVAQDMPTLLTGGTAPSTRKSRRLEARERLVWRRADGYVTITEALRGELVGRFGARDRVIVAPDGARIPPRRPAAAVRGGRRAVVGYAGHLYPWKGVDVLLQAVAGLPEVDVLIVGGLAGEPDLARVQALASALAPGRVTFTGQVPPAAVASCLLDADVLVLPNTPNRLSAAYTSPLKLFEYMASGRPIVASNLPAIREVLTDGETAVLADAGNAAALRAAIAGVLGDAGLSDRLAGAAFTAVQAFSWERRAARIEAVVLAVAARRKTRAGTPRRNT